MSFTIFDATIPVLARALENLNAVIGKGAAHAVNEKIDQAVLLQARLYPDMYPLSRQIQIACDMSKGCVARLTAIEVPRFEDTESTFAELQSRVSKTVAIVRGVSAAQLLGADERPIHLKMGSLDIQFPSGWLYLQRFVLPNVYFHCTTAYAILRHCGVKLGKGDFVGSDK